LADFGGQVEAASFVHRPSYDWIDALLCGLVQPDAPPGERKHSGVRVRWLPPSERQKFVALAGALFDVFIVPAILSRVRQRGHGRT